MEKYSVLLVDDEEEAIETIIKKLEWETLGFEIAGYAMNGVKALEMAEKARPDVVMTDIKMPFMNGLQLARELKKMDPKIRILLFTGFDEFDYAREAVHLEVEEYILKPVNAAELREVFLRLKKSLDAEREEKRGIEKLQNYYIESLPLLQAGFLGSLIEGKADPSQFQRNCEDYRIDLHGPVYLCAVVHTSVHYVPDNMSYLLLDLAVQKQVREHFEKPWSAEVFTYLGNTVMIAQLDSEKDVPSFTDDCDRFCKTVLRIIGAKISAGIGRPCRGIEELPSSYSGAREAVSYRVLYGYARAINIAEIAPRESAWQEDTGDLKLGAFFKAIHMGTEEGIGAAVDGYTADLSENMKSVRQYKLALLELVMGLHRFAVNNYIDLEAMTGFAGDRLYLELTQMDIAALGRWLKDIAGKCSHALASARSSTSKSYVVRAEEYVREHYAESDLSLDKMCAALGVSASYFSSVFKKEAGKSFISYLTDYRLERAEKMLIETNEKNYVIALRIGYMDPNYFSYVFKKAYGMSPSRYRAQHRREGE